MLTGGCGVGDECEMMGVELVEDEDELLGIGDEGEMMGVGLSGDEGK